MINVGRYSSPMQQHLEHLKHFYLPPWEEMIQFYSLFCYVNKS